MRRSPSIFSQPIFLIISFFLIIGVVYSPVLYFNYVFHDDATYWIKLKEYGFKQYAFDTCLSEYRYGDALLITLQNLFIHKVSDLKFLRFLAMVISSCNAYLLLLQMRRLSFSDIQAFLIISAIFFLPGFADVFCCGAYSSVIALGIFIASWSFHRVDIGKGILIPVFSLLFAISIYPPAAMFYWVMMGMNILFTHDRFSASFKKSIIRSMAAGITGLLIYAAFIILMNHIYSNKLRGSLYDPSVTTHDLFSKLQWFFQEPMNNALNLWDIFPRISTSVMVSGFVILTALVVLIKKLIHLEAQQRKIVALTYCWQLGLFILVFFLTFLPNLAAKENAAFYRCLIPLASLICLVLVWAVSKWMDIIPRILTKWIMIALLSAIVICAGIKMSENVLYYRALPSHIEWNAYKSMAEEIRSKNVDAIYVLPPHHFTRERYDEFGVVSSHYMFDIYHLIYCAFRETWGSKQYSVPMLYISYPGDNLITKLKEIYFKELPNGSWEARDINKDDPLVEIDPSLLGNSIQQGIFIIPTYHKRPSKRQNWYILNLNDYFSP